MPPPPLAALFAVSSASSSSLPAASATTTAIWPPVGIPATASSSSLWDGSGGPALIIVFVAVGLLAGAFAALLIVRHIPPGGSVFGGDDGDGGFWFFDAGPALGREPKLYSAVLGDVRCDAGAWGDIMPLSAKFVPDDDASQVHEAEDDASSESPADSPLSPVSRFLDAVREYYIPSRPLPRVPSDDAASLETHVDADIDEKSLEAPAVSGSGTVRIAVAVAMPSACNSVYYGRAEDADGDDDERQSIAEVPRIAAVRRAPAPGPGPLRELYLGLAEVRTGAAS